MKISGIEIENFSAEESKQIIGEQRMKELSVSLGGLIAICCPPTDFTATLTVPDVPVKTIKVTIKEERDA